MEKDKSKSGNRGLVILLCVLLVIIVGLGVGIGVVMNRSDTYSPFDEIVFMNVPTAADYVVEIERFGENLESVEDGIDLYEAAIAANYDNKDITLGLRIACCYYLFQNDLVTDAIAQLDSVNQNELNDDQKVRLYIAYRNMYLYNGNEEEVGFYDALIAGLAEEVVSEDV